MLMSANSCRTHEINGSTIIEQTEVMIACNLTNVAI